MIKNYYPPLPILLESVGGEMVLFGYLSGFVHCFVGYWIAFLHISVLDLGGSGVGFV